MPPNILPSSIELLKLLSDQLPTAQAVFDKTSDAYRILGNLTRDPIEFSRYEEFQNSPEVSTFIQCLFLLTLTMFGGIHSPIIQSLQHRDARVHLMWDSGQAHQFTMGVWDDAFERFAQHYQKTILKRPPNSTLDSSIIDTLYQITVVYAKKMETSIEQINTLLKHKTTLAPILQDEINQELLFVLLAALPLGEINALFMHIQQYFPDDLVVESDSGNRIDVTTFFQMTSSDLNYLIEKVKIYFRLYYTVDMPIIKHITQSKTRDFLKELLSKGQIFDETIQNLHETRDQQFQLRLDLYTIFLKILGPICKANQPLDTSIDPKIVPSVN